MPKSNANGGSASVLDEPADDFTSLRRDRSYDSRSPRPTRTASDAEADGGEPFLRARRRVPVRRGLIPAWAKSGWGIGLFTILILVVAGVLFAILLGVRSFLRHDSRFRIESPASIQIVGGNAGSPASEFSGAELTRPQLLSVFGADIGRNLFVVPLAKRRDQLEQIAWVEHATVMRLFPNQIRVRITERTPIAFVLIHGRIQLVDASGVILDMTPQQMTARHYAFPVVSGIDPADPLSVRAARMSLFDKFIADLDSTGEHLSARLSEVNLSDPENVRATVPLSGSDILLDFGQDDFLARWRNFQAHIAEWQQQYPHLASVDLRYEREVVLQMAPNSSSDSSATLNPSDLQKSPAASTPAMHPSPAAKHPAPPHRRASRHDSHPAQHAVPSHAKPWHGESGAA